MMEAVCEYIQTARGEGRQGEPRNWGHGTGTEHQALLDREPLQIQTLLPPLEL